MLSPTVAVGPDMPTVARAGVPAADVGITLGSIVPDIFKLVGLPLDERCKESLATEKTSFAIVGL
jgi:hypothetical protein